MSIRKAYQTLEDRDINNIERDGPFLCSHKYAWLGKGYYFWDSFIKNAHWWGQAGACYRNGYVICESTFELDDKRCFNLVDNPTHLEQFNDAISVMKNQKLYVERKTTVARVINYFRGINVFDYEAIRVYGVNSVGAGSPFSNRTIFVYRENIKSLQYLDSTPAIQINFFRKDSLSRTGFKIIFPHEYAEGYLV